MRRNPPVNSSKRLSQYLGTQFITPVYRLIFSWNERKIPDMIQLLG
jgi:hypothetical protein